MIKQMALCVTLALSAGSAIAATEITPGGPWLTPNQQVSLSRISTYEDLEKKLFQLEKSSKGLVELEVIGHSGQERNIYLAKVGNPANTPVMIMTQQHGNEQMTTEAALQVLQQLATGNSKVMSILDKLYVLMIVRANPDGAVLDTRGNTDPSAPPRNSGSCFASDGTVIDELLDQGRGVYSTTFVDADGVLQSDYDINRYHWHDWSQSDQVVCNPGLSGPAFDPDVNPVPEAQAVLDAFNYYAPLWIADFHHQATYVTDDGENVTSSILWPRNENVEAGVVDLSKQLCVTIYEHMQQFGFSTVTLYPGGTFPGIARNAYGLGGSGSILVELKGAIGQKQSGMIIKHASEQMWAILEATANESLFGIDPLLADEIPADRYFYYKDFQKSADDSEE
ncbi:MULTISPECIES: M14 family zinc carboxypeptidase [Desulfosediminicola]|uniref:M14 family zinc carboxypeptidase n=1 Tax=Desulfosediminicola TaxID=2886823 RepID=UPI0010AC0910|nr:M14 family zinc carboxypeptidase [Desulfosediminicola ganghwensis]